VTGDGRRSRDSSLASPTYAEGRSRGSSSNRLPLLARRGSSRHDSGRESPESSDARSDTQRPKYNGHLW
jgi:hypothetical protein